MEFYDLLIVFVVVETLCNPCGNTVFFGKEFSTGWGKGCVKVTGFCVKVVFFGLYRENFPLFFGIFCPQAVFKPFSFPRGQPVRSPKPPCGKRIFLTPKTGDSTSPWISFIRDSTRVSARKAAYMHLSLTK
jgi:hypothetical protein